MESTDMLKNISWQNSKVTYEDRCRILNQQGVVVWFTGLSGSGKSTIAIELEKDLISRGKIAYVLDGDNIRHGLNSDLGFSANDRTENIRRITEVSALFKDAGVITLVSFISPFRKMREFAKEKIGKDSFIEVYIKTDLETCINRDPKGLYKKALNGEIKDLTGIGSPYEEPDSPDIIIETEKTSISESARIISDYILNLISK